MSRNLCTKAIAVYLLMSLSLQPAWPTPQVNVPTIGSNRPETLLPGQSWTLLPDGRWLTVGGQSESGPLSTAVIEGPIKGSAPTVSSTVMLARAWHSATVLPTGQVLVIGGIGTNAKIVQTAEIFDPNSGTSRLLTARFQPRAHHSATLLTDGRVLIAGGIGVNGVPLTAVELWDPRSNSISVIPAVLTSERRDHVASLLPNGTVLLWGGTDGLGNPISYADLYDSDHQSFSSTTFIVSPLSDLNLPFLEASLPADGESGVEPNTLIALRFSKPLKVDTVNFASVKLTGPSGPVPATIVPAEGGMLCFVAPNSLLQAGGTYRLSLQYLTDTRGLSLIYKTVSFTVARDSSQGSGASQTGPQTSDAADMAPLVAPFGVTALSGQVLRLNGMPLAQVGLSVGNHHTLSDKTGRFILENVEAGNRVLLIEGKSANKDGKTYGLYEDGVKITAKQTNILDYKIWMTALDTAHEVNIPSPTTSEVLVTTPLIPGMELRIPPKTVIHDHYGKLVTKVGITPIPVDRPPFPLAKGVVVPEYFTIQPGSAVLTVGANEPKGASIVYPNSNHAPAGARANFWNYEPDNKGWYVYGLGTVTPDQQQVIPDAGVVIYEFTGAMKGTPDSADTPGQNPTNHQESPDPVDLGTGLFEFRNVDFYLPDVIPIVLTRTYRQGSTMSRSFGRGTTLTYDTYLVGDVNPYTYIDLILPDGGRIHYYRTSPGTGLSSVYLPFLPPPRFSGSMIVWNPSRGSNGGWDLAFKDGSLWSFPEAFGQTNPAKCAILFERDRFGNTLNINRSSNGNINQVISPNGRWLQFTYDACNRVTQITDNSGRSTMYSYDSTDCTIGRLFGFTDQDQRPPTTFYYGENGATADEMTSIIDSRGVKYLQNSYDVNGRVSQQTLANSGTYLFHYTLAYGPQIKNRFTGIVAGPKTECCYALAPPPPPIVQAKVTNPNGNVLIVNFSVPPIFPSDFQTGGYVTSAIVASGRPEQQTFTFNSPFGIPLSVTDQLGRVTSYAYDANGNVISVTRLSGTSSAATTSYAYDPNFSRVTSVTDPLGHTIAVSYDDSTNQATITDALGNQTTVTHNSLGQVTSVVDPMKDTPWQFGYTGGDLSSITNPLLNTASMLQDGAGRLVSKVDANGDMTKYTYDAVGNLTGVIDALGETTLYGFNQNNYLTSVTDPRNTGTPTQFGYDNMDHVMARTDALLKADNRQYDLNGDLVCYTDRKGQITVYTYDGLNRRTGAVYGAASCAATTSSNTAAYTYDGGNRLTAIVDSVSGNITRQYDGLDNLTYESTPQGSVTYHTDAAGRRKDMTVTGQPIVTYSWDDANRLRGITQGTTTASINYDTLGRRTSLTLPNGVNVQYTYDAASHLTGITYANGGTILGTLNYTYDSSGRRTQLSSAIAQATVPAAVASTSYNAANQLKQWGSSALTYDADANLQTDGTNTYSWSVRNQLASITGASAATFQYDGLGRRVSKTINGASTAFLYDGSNVIQELSGTTPSANLFGGLAFDEVFARTDASGASNYLADAIGSTVALTDTSGTVQTTYAYEPFGNATQNGAASTNSYQFTGRENDGTGMDFYRARYYKPSIGRFASEDPIDFAGGINLYAYVASSPLNFTDPSGLKPWSWPNYTDPGPPPAPTPPPLPPVPPDWCTPGQSCPPPSCPGAYGPPLNAGFNLPGLNFGYSLQGSTLHLNYQFGLSTSLPGGGLGVGMPGTGTTVGASWGPLIFDTNGVYGLGGPLDFTLPGVSGSLPVGVDIPLQLWPLPPC
jgi:RHS repeat-associated protein